MIGMEEALTECLQSMIRVLRFSSSFTKRDEKELKKILKKLEPGDLTYLANLFDELYEEIRARIEETCQASERGLAGE